MSPLLNHLTIIIIRDLGRGKFFFNHSWFILSKNPSISASNIYLFSCYELLFNSALNAPLAFFADLNLR